MLRLLKTAAVAALVATPAFIASSASAQEATLEVRGIQVAICDVDLQHVSSGTLSMAEILDQQIANLNLICNSADGATLVVEAENADLWKDNTSGGPMVNYAIRLDAEDNDFDIDQRDMAPGDQTVTRTSAGFSPDLAQGIDADFFINVNVDAGGPYEDGQVLFPGIAAPAGDYYETFYFTLSPTV